MGQQVVQRSKRCLTTEKITRVYHEWLKVSFPNIFNKQFQPLPIGVFHQLCAELPAHISKTDLRIVLGWYASRFEYLQNMQNSQYRINLDGTISDTISDAEKQAAKQKIKQGMAARKKRKQKIAREPFESH